MCDYIENVNQVLIKHVNAKLKDSPAYIFPFYTTQNNFAMEPYGDL